jgi:hypothetical protein
MSGGIIPNGAGQALSITIDARDPGAEGRIRDMVQREMVPQIIEASVSRTVDLFQRPRFA